MFWVWNGFTYYTERFESDGVEQRGPAVPVVYGTGALRAREH
ncbi:hypothetical protein [Actinomycetospora endophytica]|nr:hypothetical protein [Actinomycetospora endophytica]